MRVLINYTPDQKGWLPNIATMLKKQGMDALATEKDYSMEQLLALAKLEKVSAKAILLSNEVTLSNLVKSSAKRKVTVASFRGSRLNFSVPVIVTSPFNHIRTVKHGKWLLAKDISKLQHIDKKPIQLPMHVCLTTRDFNHAKHILAACLIISIDIETVSEGRISCISFTGLLPNLRTITYVIPFIDFGVNHWDNPEDYQRAIQAMQAICQNDVPKMMFNATFDAQHLIMYHAWPNNLILDVMGMQHSQFAELPKTLDFTASIHCYDYYQWKHEADVARNDKDIRCYWYYCAKDSWYTLRCFLNMCGDYPAYAIRNYQMAFKLTYPCLYCSFEGVAIDTTEREKVKLIANVELSKRENDLRIMAANPNFNPGSPKQTAAFLYDILGAKRIKGDSTDAKVLMKVAGQHPLLARVCDDIIVYREEQKAIGTYYEFFLKNNRLLYSLSPFATDTSRFSSRSSNLRTYDNEGNLVNYGTQIQNMPEYAKGMIVADSGYELFEADNNKSEARCVAELSNCPGLQTVLADMERDFYKLLAGIFFGIPYDNVTKELRNKVIKRIIHGTNYMMQEDTFIDTVGVKQILEGAALLGMKVTDVRSFVTYLLEIYHKKFPEVRADYRQTRLEVLRTNKLVSPMGHTRYFFGDITEDHKIFRSAVAHKPQNLSVTILNKGFWRVYNLCIDSGGELRLKAQIHDSNFGQYKAGLREKYEPLILECMNNPVKMPTGRILNIPVDFSAGKTWLEVKGG